MLQLGGGSGTRGMLVRAGVVSLLGVMRKEWWGGVVCSYEDYFLQY